LKLTKIKTSMFNSTLMEFDLGLLQDEPTCASVYKDVPATLKDVSANIPEQQMEEMDKLGWLESTSDLQAFMDIGALPEIKGDKEVENVMNDVQKFLQQYDIEEAEKHEGDSAIMTDEILAPEEMAAAEDLLDELLKSSDIDLSSFDLTEQEVVKEEQPDLNETVEVKDEPMNDSGFIDMTNVTKVITDDGKEIFIMIAPPSAYEEKDEISAEPASILPDEPSTLTSDDSDWTPDSPKATKGRPPVKRATKTKSGRKAPYVTDKKERKKLQNVEAARRYRDKKKAEQTDIESEESVLATKNKTLKSQVAELEAEVKTMRKLMVELGMIKA